MVTLNSSTPRSPCTEATFNQSNATTLPAHWHGAMSAHPALCNTRETCSKYQHRRLICVAHKKIIRVNNVSEVCMVPTFEFMLCVQDQESRRLSIHQRRPCSFSVLVYECVPFLA